MAKLSNRDNIRLSALAYERGAGVEKDLAKASGLFLEGASRGDETCMRYVEVNFWENGALSSLSFEQYLDTLKQSAQNGNMQARLRLAELYINGGDDSGKRKERVERDYEHAAHWYAQAAKWGSVEGLRKLGDLYAEGKGVEQNAKKAAELYEQSAMFGDNLAMQKLALLYIRGGKSLIRDTVKSVYWYHKCEARRLAFLLNEYPIYEIKLNEPAAYLSGTELYEQDAFEARWREAHKRNGEYNNWYDRGYDENGNWALIALPAVNPYTYYPDGRWDGRTSQNDYECGLKLYESDPPDYVEARFHFERAAKDEHKEALYMLGLIYYDGLGIECDCEKADYYINKACMLGSDAAQLYRVKLMARRRIVRHLEDYKESELERAISSMQSKEDN